MQKRTKSKSRRNDVLVVFFCLLTASFFLYLFWRDLNAFTTRNDKENIGTISFKQKVAQRKFDDRVVWERVAQNTELYYGDTIRTADFAQATITFNDGTTLDLYENTMVQVYWTEDNGLQIDVDGGDIQVDTSASTTESAVAVKLSDGSQVAMEAGSALAVKADTTGGASNVEVKSGTVQVTTESGATAALTFGESVNIEKGSNEIKKNPLTVITPGKELKLLNVRGEALPVKLEWKSSDDDAVTVQTSRAKDFSTIEMTRTVSDATSTELAAQDGTFYWRVFTDATKDSPVTGRVNVETIARAQGISPATATQFRYRTTLPRLGFRWNGNEYADHYRLRISTTPDMQNALVDRTVEETFANVDSLEAGAYYWQVTPHYTVNNMGYASESDVYQFSIVQNAQIRPPELSAPAENAQITYRTTTVQTNFVWKSELKNVAYDVQISRDPAFTAVVYQAETTETRLGHNFATTELADGTYYWRVIRKATDEDDVTPQSEVRSFTVVKYVPQDNKLLYPPEEFSTEQAKLAGTTFMWKLSDDYVNNAQSVLQVSTRADFAALQLERTVDASYFDNMLLPQGTYWWRVGAKTADGTIEGLTAPRMFTVLAELGTPEFTTPKMNQELIAYNGTPVTFTWNTVSGADYYTVRVVNSKDQVIAQNLSVAGTSAQFVLPDDTYTARLQSVAEAVGSSAPRVSSVVSVGFSVRAPLTVVQRLPADNTRIAGLTALREPTVFTWESQKDAASSYRFELRKQQKDGSARVVETQSGKQTRASYDRLTEGTYIWKVYASTADGIPLDSAERTLTIEPVPLLTAPTLTAPKQNVVMDGAYLRTHRTIDFAWNAVNGATAYTFTLSKRNKNGTVKVVMTEKNTTRTSYTLTDLSVLDVGDFVWTVTAASYARDGYEEQRGRVATGTFKIDFASPTKIDTVQPEIMYGE